MFEAVQLRIPATKQNFDETSYLEANPDVAAAVADGRVASGREHFFNIGHTESRMLATGVTVKEAKTRKVDKLIEDGVIDPAADIRIHASGAIDYLPPEVALAAGIVETDAVSSNGYDPQIMQVIEQNADAWILDAGAGLRDTYFTNVVNYEIVPYPSTDVLGVVERMPFADGAFDFVVSMAVLEHVRDPFAAAQEMIRVLRPGGQLICAVPFLQPYHGYPHHYFNMTKTGLRSLFEADLEILDQRVPMYFHPIWVMQWIVNAWARGLSEKAAESFRRLTIGEIMQFTPELMNLSYVAELDEEKQFELASGTFLTARKPD